MCVKVIENAHETAVVSITSLMSDGASRALQIWTGCATFNAIYVLMVC